MTTWTEEMRAELSNLFHLAHCALAGTSPGRYERKLWASKKFSEAHPEVSSTAAYKELCREEAWRYALTPDPGPPPAPKRKWKDRCLVCQSLGKTYDPDVCQMVPCPYCDGTGYKS
jgi:hypothetical protein